MEPFLIGVYSLLFLTFVYKSKMFSIRYLRPSTLVLFAAIKIFAALLYYWLYSEIPTFYDSEHYFRDGNVVFSAIQESPLYYLHLLLLPNNYFPEPEHLCSYIDDMGLWYDFTGYTIVRVNAFIRLFSFGYVSIHFLFFSFLSFIGAFYLFRFFAKVTTLSEYYILGVLFLVPEIVFWTSGLHKEALVLFSSGILIYNTYQYSLRSSKWRLVLIIFSLAFLANVRMYMTLILLPALIAYYWNEKSKIKAIIPYFVTYGVVLLSVIAYDVIAPNSKRLAYKITEFQYAFINSTGNTSFPTEVVSNSWSRIIQLFPEHFVNGFMYPLYNQCVSNWCRLSSIMSMILVGILVLSLFKIKYRYLLNNTIALFCFSIGFSLMGVIGVVVSNAGAIVRYRSIALIFIFIGLMVSFQKVTKA